MLSPLLSTISALTCGRNGPYLHLMYLLHLLLLLLLLPTPPGMAFALSQTDET